MLRLLGQRLVRALGTAPRARDWLLAGSVLTVFTAVALIVGFVSGLLHVSMPADPGRQALFALVAVIVPCLGEEVLFRVLLVPHPDEPGPWVGWASVSVLLFALWHPLNAALLLPHAWPLFADPRFILLTVLLGAGLVLLYRRTGSIWPAVAVHWAVVVTWKAFLSGPVFLFGDAG